MKELRSRMRGWRAPGLLLLVAGGAGAVYLIRLWMLWPMHVTPDEFLIQIAALGHRLFIEVMATAALLCMGIVPALTAGAFAEERENRTFEALLLTHLDHEEMIIGKLGAMIGFVLFLLIGVLPVAALSFVFGGVSPGDVVIALVLILTTVLAQGMLGIYISLRASGTAVAAGIIVFAYLAWMLLLSVVALLLLNFPTIVAVAIFSALLAWLGVLIYVRPTRRQLLRPFCCCWSALFFPAGISLLSTLIFAFHNLLSGHFVLKAIECSNPAGMILLTLSLSTNPPLAIMALILYLAVHVAVIRVLYHHTFKRLEHHRLESVPLGLYAIKRWEKYKRKRELLSRSREQSSPFTEE